MGYNRESVQKPSTYFSKPINQGFTIIEIMVALVILSVGLLGMAGMTVVVMRGNRGAEDLASATNVCQQKIEELKDISWTALGDETTPGSDEAINHGLQAAGMVQESNLNSQGLTFAQLCIQQSAIDGTPCHNQTTTNCNNHTTAFPAITQQACIDYLEAAGPYKFTRTFAICSGREYPGVLTTAAEGSAASPSSFPNSAEPNCLVNPNDSTTRAQSLSCEDNDILTPGTESTEKMIKILCTWRDKSGRCHYVPFEALRMTDI